VAATRVSRACRRLRETHTPLSAAALANSVGLSIRQLRRDFQEQLRMSVREWIAGERAERLRRRLPNVGASGAIFAAGYGSGSAGYASAKRELGMTPATFARGGRGERIRFGVTTTRFGVLLVASTERGICHVALGDDAAALHEAMRNRFHAAQECVEDLGFAKLVAAVAEAVERGEPAAEGLPLDLRGTAFQKRVWKLLQAIPRGETVTYRELAQKLKMPAGARAVARACASNTVAVLVPCHRVLRTDGGLGGFRWGLKRKRALLEAERASSANVRKD
jgi:AraC family transcriptional regulator of adaptative response/methylated-DNA-[protein]-cysteine methyltransferase